MFRQSVWQTISTAENVKCLQKGYSVMVKMYKVGYKLIAS